MPHVMQASLIEYNATAVDAAINAVREALAGGLSWKELGALIEGEREAGNPVASMVHSLQLESNRVTLLLSNLLDGDDGDDESLTRPATKVVALLPTSLPCSGHAGVHCTCEDVMAMGRWLAVHTGLWFPCSQGWGDTIMAVPCTCSKALVLVLVYGQTGQRASHAGKCSTVKH